MADDWSQILDEWHRQLAALRTDAGARRLIEHLPSSPVITAPRAASLVGVSDRAARTALDVLERRGILTRVDIQPPPSKQGRPATHFAATLLLDATAAWAR